MSWRGGRGLSGTEATQSKEKHQETLEQDQGHVGNNALIIDEKTKLLFLRGEGFILMERKVLLQYLFQGPGPLREWNVPLG